MENHISFCILIPHRVYSFYNETNSVGSTWGFWVSVNSCSFVKVSEHLIKSTHLLNFLNSYLTCPDQNVPQDSLATDQHSLITPRRRGTGVNILPPQTKGDQTNFWKIVINTIWCFHELKDIPLRESASILINALQIRLVLTWSVTMRPLLVRDSECGPHLNCRWTWPITLWGSCTDSLLILIALQTHSNILLPCEVKIDKTVIFCV